MEEQKLWPHTTNDLVWCQAITSIDKISKVSEKGEKKKTCGGDKGGVEW